jgi:hypothetical protein
MKMMKKVTQRQLTLKILVILVSLLGFSYLSWADLPLKISSEVAIYSKYIWRGFKLDGDPVMQQGLYLGLYDFTLGIWGSFDIDNDDTLDSEELDYIIDYTHKFDKFSISVGHTYYDFPATDGYSKEFYVGIGFEGFPLSPTLTWYHDYGDEDSGGGDGDYLVLELSYSLPLGQSSLSLDLGAHIGYNHELFINGDGGDLGFSLGLSIPLSKNCTFSPVIGYSIPFGDLEDSGDGNQDEQVYFGCVFSFSL